MNPSHKPVWQLPISPETLAVIRRRQIPTALQLNEFFESFASEHLHLAHVEHAILHHTLPSTIIDRLNTILNGGDEMRQIRLLIREERQAILTYWRQSFDSTKKN